MFTRLTEALLLFAFTLFTAVACASVTTGNLLTNPGGEAGSESPWILGSRTEFSGSSATLPGGSISATEGTYWFKGDETFGTGSPGINQVDLAKITQQFVDVGSLGPIESLTLGADFFGVAEPISGQFNSLKMVPRFGLTFYDSNLSFLGFLIETLPGEDISGVTSFLHDLRVTITTASIPATTSFVHFTVENEIEIDSITSLATTQLITGIDDAFISVTYSIPEPSAILLASFGFIGLFIRSRVTNK